MAHHISIRGQGRAVASGRHDHSHHVLARQYRQQQVQPQSAKLGWLWSTFHRRDELCLGDIDLLGRGRLSTARRCASQEVRMRVPGLSTVVFLLAFTPQLPTELPQIRFNSGQNVVPYFEGWIRNPDGTFDLVFGYFNRNWKEELAIPPGPENKVEPNGPDAGQPTYFLPRRQRWMYRLRVPADFGNKEITWTITAHGHSEVAYGNLLAAEEITERVVSSNGNFNPGEGDPNEPPSIGIDRNQTATTSTPLVLNTSIRDDGLPKPRPARAPRPAPDGGFGG